MGACDANDPQNGGCMASAPTLDLTTSLQGYSKQILLPLARHLEERLEAANQLGIPRGTPQLEPYLQRFSPPFSSKPSPPKFAPGESGNGSACRAAHAC